jgi:hypothetical protein
VSIIENEAEVFRIIEVFGDEDVELFVAERFEGADVSVPQPRRDLDGVALQSTKEVPVDGNRGIA